ncbi:unnamed protein product [Prunus armeniaca]|uniref:DUF4378 domain-containing protein n=1 Tax=Prunus armeniaca TaxID=36596 RepID=A0A6J5XKB7_PRUAR|nr:unnamed protein product [Prunus armeniaca]
MGKQLQRQDSGVESNRPGCMWSLMHMLDYHNWNNVKNMLPHRKRAGGRRVRCNYGSRKATLNSRDIGQREEFAAADAEPLLVKHPSTEISSAKKRSGKSRTKASSAKEKPREESTKSWILSFHVQSWLWRTSEVHDVQPSENCLDKTGKRGSTSPSKKQALSTEESEKVMELAPNQKPTKTNQAHKDISSDQFNDHADILEIFKANKEFFLKFLQDPDVNTNQFPGLQNSKNKVRLTKSRSFPVADSSQARNIRPKSTLKHKQNEVWSFPKGEILLSGTQTPKLVTSESQEDYSMKSMPYVAGDISVGSSVMKQETSFSSPGLPEGFSHRGWNQLVINRFKDITQKLMHAIQEGKKENADPSIKALFRKDPSGCDEKELSETPDIAMGQQRNKVDGFDDNLGKPRIRRVRRTSSLDESLNRYTQLFESSYSSDQSKWDRSRSLKLKSEEKVPSTGNAQKFTRRNLSLPDLDYFCSTLNRAPKDAFRLGMPVKNAVDHNTNKESDGHVDPKSVSFPVDTADKSEQLDAITETEFQNNMVERSESSGNIVNSEDLDEHLVEPAIGEIRTHQKQEIGLRMNPESELAQPIESSILEPNLSDYTTSHAEFSTSEGSEINPRSSHVNESDCLAASRNIVNTEIEHKSVDNHSARFVFNKVDDPDSECNYVKYVLELSGFIGHEDLGTWHSQDQPLDPALFKELEACFQHELDHQLLFDLVNETLLEVYERSYTYFPRALSLSGCIRPMPKGHHLLDDVWKRVSSYLSLRPEMDQSLDDVVARDLAKGDRWMNLQWDTECVALELEDLIFDELLDEAICI